MKTKLILLAGVCAGAIAFPAFAQTAEGTTAVDEDTIIVTAQRTSQRLQDVPSRSALLVARRLKSSR